MTSTSKDFTFEGGDIRIKVKVKGSNAILDGLVCSQALCLSSEVWRKFIFPYLFALAHHRYDNIPQGIQKYDLLLALARTCRKYACATLITPYAKKWIDSNMEGWKDPQYREGYLFISWVFGNMETFTAQAVYLCTTLYVIDSKFLRASELGFFDLDSELMPPCIQSSMMDARTAAINFIVDRIEDHLKLLRDSEALMCTRGDKSCDLLVFSTLVTGLAKHFWPLSRVAAFQGPFEMILSKLSLAQEELKPNRYYEYRHEECRKLELEPVFEEALTGWDHIGSVEELVKDLETRVNGAEDLFLVDWMSQYWGGYQLLGT
ncbi:hypothetical protein HYFRA_00004664 [Hymenoscyphus fraxineus]|uniref:Uncharacterized protein n=1 Tax=Hymenoscyphus fraxineus TaxID=746836 RepID=A0A9N9PIP9_9HELO|nr:hypothetical protein HYFRA_00004664 [Hymenoscyphus fraxineus]